MDKKCIRYFGGFIDAQENWLNAMSEQGYRLVRTGKLVYAFEKCEPNQYRYCVEFVAHKSTAESKAYKEFLEDTGARVLFKNANLNCSVGKIRLRPYGEGRGKIATSPGSYNRELLIVEKVNDGKPFTLHTTVSDKISYYKVQRNAYLSLWLLSVVLLLWQWFTTAALTQGLFVALLFTVLTAIPTMAIQKRLWMLKRQSDIYE